MEKKYDVVRFTMNNGLQKASFNTVARDLTYNAAKTIVEQQERLSNGYGTFYKIVEPNS